MPATPDKLDVIIGLLNDVKAAVLQASPAPAPAPTPPPAEDETAKFLAKWADPTEAEFQARYGVSLGQPIPQLLAYDEAEVVFRARACYDPRFGTPGKRFSDQAAVRAAVGVIAYATEQTAGKLYETGFGLTDQDVAAYVFLVGLVETQDEYRRGMQVNVNVTPAGYKGLGLREAAAGSFAGGTPSHQ
jgi:hypothetical protein